VSLDRWVHPELLGAVAAVLSLAVGTVALTRVRSRRSRLRLLGTSGRLPTGAASSDVALLVALAAIGMALIGPRLGERTVAFVGSGVDVVFAIDVSRSMDARDVPPSRLARARRAVDELLTRLAASDRAALAAFAGSGVLLAPLTPDRIALSELLSGVDSELVSPRSSNPGDGVRAAVSAFEAGSERPRVVFLLSDGEDPERHRDLGISDARRAGARVLVAGIGSETGASIPDHGVPLVDRDGAVVVSRRDLRRLGRLAAATGGEVFAGDTWGAIDFDRAAAAIRRDAGGSPGELVERRVRAVQVAPLAALAFALLLFEGLPLPRAGRGSSPRRRVWTGVAAALAYAGFFATPSPAGDGSRGDEGPEAPDSTLEALEAQVRARPREPDLLVRLGAARLERGRHEAAARAFLAATLYATDPRDASIAYHDLGVVALEAGDLVAAADAFFDALALVPDDERTRFNLEWTLQMLKRHPSPPPRSDAAARDQEPGAGSAEAEASEARPAPLEGESVDSARPPVPEILVAALRERLLRRIEDDPLRAIRGSPQEGPGWQRRRAAAGVPVW
jgi:Ca-activated chloride channel family protein